LDYVRYLTILFGMDSEVAPNMLRT